MAEFSAEVEPGDVGFDADRLATVDSHFARYVDEGKLAGWQLAVSRRGQLAHVSHYGKRDLEADLPVEADTTWRWYSMTKPVTSVAAMMLYERGAFQLTDPVSRFIPAFADTRVYTRGSAQAPGTEPLTTPIRIWHLLTHTAGLTYGFHHAGATDEIYRARGFEFGYPENMDLAACCEAYAQMPLAFQPGSEWNYSVATDVLGRVVEVASGQRLDEFFANEIFRPLGMTDAGFWVPEQRLDSLAALYLAGPRKRLVRNERMAAAVTREPRVLSGGGGLVGTAADYHRFSQMLLGRGQLDGVRLLGSRTVDFMTRNHLPGGADLEEFGRPLYAEVAFAGTGFGLGFGVVTDPVASKALGSAGEYSWGGLASTAFWVDPQEEITAMFFTQLIPSSTYPIRPQFRQLIYQALVD
ncbi:MAG: serine hydrolase domain-containing protein [Sciscionella sp.]